MKEYEVRKVFHLSTTDSVSFPLTADERIPDAFGLYVRNEDGLQMHVQDYPSLLEATEAKLAFESMHPAAE